MRAGDRTPDVVFRDEGTGETTSLFALLRRSRPVVLIGGEAMDEKARRPISALDLLGIDCFLVTPQGTTVRSSRFAACLQDVYGDFRRQYDMPDEFLYLIRPDGYVGLSQRPVDEYALRVYLEKLFPADRVHDAFVGRTHGRRATPEGLRQGTEEVL